MINDHLLYMLKRSGLMIQKGIYRDDLIWKWVRLEIRLTQEWLLKISMRHGRENLKVNRCYHRPMIVSREAGAYFYETNILRCQCSTRVTRLRDRVKIGMKPYFFFLQNSIGWVEATQKTNANRSKEERRNEWQAFLCDVNNGRKWFWMTASWYYRAQPSSTMTDCTYPSWPTAPGTYLFTIHCVICPNKIIAL